MNRLQAIEFVRYRYDVTESQLKGSCRVAYIAKPRHVLMFLLKHFCGLSYPQIGRFLGGRNHATIMHGYSKIREELLTGTLDLGIEIDLDVATTKNNMKNLSTLDKAIKEALLLFRIKMLESFEKDAFGTLIKLTKALDE